MTIEWYGKTYVAVDYVHNSSNMIDSDYDPQCRRCQLCPLYCNMMEKCHGNNKFIFDTQEHAEMIEKLNQL